MKPAIARGLIRVTKVTYFFVWLGMFLSTGTVWHFVNHWIKDNVPMEIAAPAFVSMLVTYLIFEVRARRQQRLQGRR